MAYCFTDFPRPLKARDYERARDQLREYMAHQPDVVALYEFGTVSVPGLSDLDLMVVLRDRPLPDVAERLKQRRLPPFVRELIDGGTLMITRRKDFARVQIWDDIQLSRLYGPAVETVEISADDLPSVDLCRLLDWVPERLARISGILAKTRVSVWPAIRVLYSFTKSLERFQRMFPMATGGTDELVRAARQHRESWFDGKAEDCQRLVQLLQGALDQGLYVLSFLARHLREAGVCYGSNLPKDGTLSFGAGLRLVFASDPNHSGSKDCVRLSQEVPTAVVPAQLYQHFAAYALLGGPIGEQILCHLTPHPAEACLDEMAQSHRQILSRRLCVCNDMSDFLVTHGFQQGLFRFGWYLSALSKGKLD